jgi:hypothetical protein
MHTRTYTHLIYICIYIYILRMLGQLTCEVVLNPPRYESRRCEVVQSMFSRTIEHDHQSEGREPLTYMQTNT